MATPVSQMAEVRTKVHQKLLRETEFSVLQRMTEAQLLERIQYLTDVVADELGISLSAKARDQLQQDVRNEVIGFGPIQNFLDDPTVSEIMINGPNSIFVERDGRITRSDAVFVDNGHVMRIIEKIIAPLGRRLDEASPMVDARLPASSAPWSRSASSAPIPWRRRTWWPSARSLRRCASSLKPV